MSATVTATVGAGETTHVDWHPDRLVLWVGLVTATDVHEGERWPRPPQVVGLQLNGRELLQPGGRVSGIPCKVTPACRVRVTLKSTDSQPVEVKAVFHFRTFGEPLPLAELGGFGAPITNLGA